MSKKIRIVERRYPDNAVKYIIQQKHFLFRWWWVDAYVNSLYPNITDTFNSIEEANKNLCFFDGTKTFDTVIKLPD